MDSTLALGALRIARDAGGEGVDVNGNLVERGKGDEFGIETTASSSTRGRRGQFSVQSDNRFSGRGGGVGSLPRAWRRVGVPVDQQSRPAEGQTQKEVSASFPRGKFAQQGHVPPRMLLQPCGCPRCWYRWVSVVRLAHQHKSACFLTATGSSDRHGALSETINLRAFIDSLPDMPSFEYSTDALSVVRLA